MKKSILVLAIVLTVVFAMTGCWGRDTDNSPDDTNTPNGTTPNGTTPNGNTEGTTGLNGGYGDMGQRVGYGNNNFRGSKQGYGAGYIGGDFTNGNSMYGDNYVNDGGNYNVANNNRLVARTETISREVEKLIGIDNAACIVMGDTAYIGLNTVGYKTGYGKVDITTLKTNIEKKVRKLDTGVKKVVITTDAGMLSKIREFSSQMGNGNVNNKMQGDLNSMLK